MSRRIGRLPSSRKTAPFSRQSRCTPRTSARSSSLREIYDESLKRGGTKRTDTCLGCHHGGLLARVLQQHNRGRRCVRGCVLREVRVVLCFSSPNPVPIHPGGSPRVANETRQKRDSRTRFHSPHSSLQTRRAVDTRALLFRAREPPVSRASRLSCHIPDDLPTPDHHSP